MITPIAASNGYVPLWYRSIIVKLTTGVLVLANMTDTVTSPAIRTKTNTQPAVSPGRRSGSTTFRKVRASLPPHVADASTRGGPIWPIADSAEKVACGR